MVTYCHQNWFVYSFYLIGTVKKMGECYVHDSLQLHDVNINKPPLRKYEMYLEKMWLKWSGFSNQSVRNYLKVVSLPGIQ